MEIYMGQNAFVSLCLKAALSSAAVLAVYSAPALSAERVELETGPAGAQKLVEILSKAPTLKDQIKISGAADLSSIRDTQCKLHALRPEHLTPALTDPSNRLDCSFTSANGEAGTMVWDLGAVPISAWGNRLSRFPVSFNGEYASKVFKVLHEAWKAENPESAESDAEQDEESEELESIVPFNQPLLDYMLLWGPPGRTIMGIDMVSVGHDAHRDSAAAIICSRNLEMNPETREIKVLTQQCVFIDR